MQVHLHVENMKIQCTMLRLSVGFLLSFFLRKLVCPHYKKQIKQTGIFSAPEATIFWLVLRQLYVSMLFI